MINVHHLLQISGMDCCNCSLVSAFVILALRPNLLSMFLYSFRFYQARFFLFFFFSIWSKTDHLYTRICDHGPEKVVAYT